MNRAGAENRTGGVLEKDKRSLLPVTCDGERVEKMT
jgi:hypothetical protein